MTQHSPTQHSPDIQREGDVATVDQELVAELRELFVALLKALRARQTYVPGNPLIDKFYGELGERFTELWDRLPHLGLIVDEGRFLWRDVEVFGKPIAPDNLAFRFFRDGIRSIALLPGVEEEELDDFLEIVATAGRREDSDLVASLWHRSFTFIRMEYVDAVGDETFEVPTPDRDAGAGETLDDLSEIEDVAEAGPLSDDEEGQFAGLLLGEADLTYLRRELEAEWARSLTRDVTIALLDQFEMRDHERRRQVVDILREFLPRLLVERDFSNVALIVNELQLLANRTGEVETQELVTSLLRDMSEAMAEMVSSADRTADAPGADEMTSLLGALQAEAIPTLVRAIPAVPNLRTRDQLREALDRLVGAYPAQITGLLQAEDPVLAAEAARIAGRLRLGRAEEMLVELAKRPEQLTRQAAIEALGALGSLRALEALEVGLTDADRHVRLAAVNALAQLKLQGADAILERWVTSSELEKRDQTEQMAFMKAYAGVAGGEAVAVLAKILNGRKWWGGRRSATMRASAARALGFVGTDDSRRALEAAANDRAAPVRSAVRVARRGFDADPAGGPARADIVEGDEPAVAEPGVPPPRNETE